MPSVAEVQFKATGQQTVVSAFKSVGDSASTATTKVQQNSGAMKTMGQGMKSSVSGIASAASAFATLSLSVVNTWRAYRDLTDAQIAVDKANLRVAKTTEAIRKSEADIAAIKKESGKGSLESIAFTNKQRLAEQKLAAARKDGKHTAAELAVMQDNINLAQKAGSGTSQKLTDAENKLALQKEQLGVQTDVAKEAQERFNDTQQNFYLSILPTALSGFASLSMAFSGLKGMFSGGGGLIGMFGPLGIAIAAVSVAIIAFQTNFLGLRDAVGGVIKWFQDRFGAWKDTIQEVFGFIQKGDWAGAFNRIKEAGIAFWTDLQKSVPFFGGVAMLIDQISKGNWSGAFDTIKSAAITFWTQLKQAVPLFGTIETVIKQISSGNWEGAFKTIADSIMKGLGAIGGEKWALKFQLMKDTAIAEFNLLAHTLTQKGGAFDLINQGLAKLGKGDIVGGFTTIGAGVKKALDQIALTINSWVLTNFGVDLSKIATQAAAIGTKILDGIKSGLTFVARTWIDPILTSFFDPAAWTSAGGAILGTITAIGGTIFNFLAGAIQGAAKDPKGTASWWGNIGKAVWDGIVNWMTTNLPNATAAMQTFAQGLQDALGSSSTILQNIGRTIWNSIIDGLKAFNPQLGALFDKIKLPMLELQVGANTKPAETAVDKVAKKVTNTKPTAQVQANTNPFTQAVNKATQNARNRQVTIQVQADVRRFNQVVKTLASASRIPVQHHATGGQGTVKRPTLMLLGEGGRQEDFSIKPRGSAGSVGGDGGNIQVNVFLDGEPITRGMRVKINQGSSVVK